MLTLTALNRLSPPTVGPTRFGYGDKKQDIAAWKQAIQQEPQLAHLPQYVQQLETQLAQLKQKHTITPRYEEAFWFAAWLHKQQFRKLEHKPYMTAHLIEVSDWAMSSSGKEDVGIGGLLHDAVEDAKEYPGGKTALKADITKRFGPSVAAIVESCTEDKSITDWKTRKQGHIEKIGRANMETKHVYAADKTHMTYSLIDQIQQQGKQAVFEKLKGGEAGTLWYLDSMLDALTNQGHDRLGAHVPLVQSLTRGLKQLKQLVGAATP